MARPIGFKKTGGRTKGTPNRRSQILDSVLTDLGLDVPKRLAELLPKLDLEKQVDVLLELMQYCYPKKKALEISGEEASGEPAVQVMIHLPANGSEREGASTVFSTDLLPGCE